MSPKSRGRPPGRGRAKPRRSPTPGRRSTPPTFESVALREAEALLSPEATSLTAETLASYLLGRHWAAAQLGDREPEAVAARALIAAARRARTPAGAALLAACALVAPEPVQAELEAALAQLQLPLPAWAGAPVPEPVSAWRAQDPWTSRTTWFVTYDAPEPHVLVASADHPGGVEVTELTVTGPEALTEYDREFGDGDLPRPRHPCPAGTALAELREAMFSTDLLWPRDRTPDYLLLRLMARRRVHAHADPEPSLEERFAVDRLPDAERDRLRTAFLAIEPTPANDGGTYLVEAFLDYGEGYLPEPLAWSPDDVMFFLLDYVPRKVMLEPADRAALPALLARWVDFALAERGTDERWIAPVRDAVAEHTAEFHDLIDDESAYGAAQQLAAWLEQEGVDLTDREAVDTAARQHNAVQLARRAATADPASLPAGSALRLTVRLRHVHPRVWRRIVVPAGITLDRLHSVVQLAMGWEDAHLHDWRVGEDRYTDDRVDGGRPERGVRLVDLLSVGESIDYLYDFGDGWEHDVVLDEILLPADAGMVPRCEAGRRACPPEDIGGPPGYAGLLTALADPIGAPEELRELAEDYAHVEPDAFDAELLSAHLRAAFPP